MDAGLDPDRVLTTDDLVAGEDVFVAATGVTSGALLRGVLYTPTGAITDSIVMRSRSGTVRRIEATHAFEKLESSRGREYSLTSAVDAGAPEPGRRRRSRYLGSGDACRFHLRRVAPRAGGAVELRSPVERLLGGLDVLLPALPGLQRRGLRARARTRRRAATGAARRRSSRSGSRSRPRRSGRRRGTRSRARPQGT